MAQNKQQHEMVRKAALLAAEKATPKDIMSLLGVSSATVSRLLRRAREAGLLEKALRVCLPDDECLALREEIYGSRELEAALRKYAACAGVPGVERAQIFPTGVHVDGDDGWDRAAQAFGRLAAPCCLDLLRGCRTVGIAYGRTLRSVVSAIASLRAAARPLKPAVTCVPLWGSPLSPWQRPTSKIFTDPTRLGATGLAADLHYALNGRRAKSGPLSLDMLPAFRPPDYPEQRFDAVLEFIARVSSYGEIFGNVASGQRGASGGLADRLDALLASVGSSDRQPGRFWSGEFFVQGEISMKVLQRATAGDLGGVFLPRATASAEDRADVEDINRRWTGVRLEHYQATADRARREHRPGVVVLAVGAARAEIVLAAIRRGLVNRLAIDADCAKAVRRLMPSGR